jgi:hypothetical protein
MQKMYILFTCIQWNMYVYINGAAVPEGTGFQVNTAAADERMQPADTIRGSGTGNSTGSEIGPHTSTVAAAWPSLRNSNITST